MRGAMADMTRVSDSDMEEDHKERKRVRESSGIEKGQVIPFKSPSLDLAVAPDVPAWVHQLQLQLQTHITTEIDRVAGNSAALQEEIDGLKALRTSDAARLSSLEKKVDELIQLQANPDVAARSASPKSARDDPWAGKRLGVSIPPPASLGGSFRSKGFGASQTADTDWSHLILGGWDVDTSKRVVEKDVEAFLEQFKIPGLERHAVFGPRTRVAHLFLHDAPESMAKSRFFEMLPRINKVFKLSNNVLMWISPSKSEEKRAMNRNTSKALEKIHRLCPQPCTEIETDWKTGIIWLRGKRVATASRRNLFSENADMVITLGMTGDDKSGLTYSFNVSALSVLLGTDVGSLEANLRTD